MRSACLVQLYSLCSHLSVVGHLQNQQAFPRAPFGSEASLRLCIPRGPVILLQWTVLPDLACAAPGLKLTRPGVRTTMSCASCENVDHFFEYTIVAGLTACDGGFGVRAVAQGLEGSPGTQQASRFGAGRRQAVLLGEHSAS